MKRFLPLLFLTACGGGGTTTTDSGIATANWVWSLPPNFPVPAVPASNSMSEAKFQLGRFLFYDRKLSGDGTFACASCHRQNLAFTDGAVVSTGATGQNTPRNAPSIVNSVYHSTLTWVNPGLVTLEKQMETPLFALDPIEMGVNDGNRSTVLQRFQNDPDYPARFSAAFPGEASPITFENIIKAIASFQRALLTGGSKFERYQRGEAALSAAEERGRLLFNSEKAECFHCHGSFNFNDQVIFQGAPAPENLFHNTGLYNLGGTGAFPANNQGLIDFTGVNTDMGAFRAASLWNVGVTAPYMHDGSIATLEEVLDFYAAGGRNITSGPYAGDGRLSPFKSDLITSIDLTAQDKADLIAFLHTLTDESLLTNVRFSNPFN
jgi:cytochrome c peroxidase